MSLIFGVGTLITGSIWARGSWGHWWVWSEPTLVSFLIIMLLYATYQPLRFAIEDPERQARYASVFAIVAGRVRAAELPRRAPVDRLPAPARARQLLEPAAEDGVHVPRLARGDGAAVRDALLVRADRQAHAHAAESAQPDARLPDATTGRPRSRGASLRRRPDRERQSDDPARHSHPGSSNNGYVAAAYIVFFAIVLIYVAIMALRLTRVERGLRELNERAERPRRRRPQDETQDEPRAAPSGRRQAR